MKVLLDTDIGSDIDDAVCLAYLLAQPECELLGITTVSGEADRRAMLASALCRVAGKRVPIFPGTEEPLLVSQRQPVAPQESALPRWPHDAAFPRAEAVEFMRRTVYENPGEVVLLSIGPLTNVALLFALDRKVARLLKGLVMMCGLFARRFPGVGPAEWNAGCDPHATAIVYQTPVQMHRSVGLDVTRRVTMKAEEVRRRFRVPLLEPVLDFAEVWFQKRDAITFHDPLAAVSLFDGAVCRFERGTVEVGLASDESVGVTYWRSGEGGPHQVAVDVDPPRFFDRYFSVFR